jgi:hypothetical protein
LRPEQRRGKDEAQEKQNKATEMLELTHVAGTYFKEEAGHGNGGNAWRRKFCITYLKGGIKARNSAITLMILSRK